MNISPIALGGIRQAQANLDRVSLKVSSLADPVDTVTLSEETVSMIMAKNQIMANSTVLRSANEMERVALSLIPGNDPSTGTPSS